MSGEWAGFLGAVSGVVLFGFGPGWWRAAKARVRPEPLAPYRYPGGDR